MNKYRKDADADLARDFLVKLNEATEKVEQYGGSFAVAHTVDGFDLRRYRLKRFPFSLVFFDAGDRRVVVAVAHDKRRPLYWQSRLPSQDSD